MKTKMNKVLIIGAAITSLFCAGCAKEDGSEETKWIHHAKYATDTETKKEFQHVASVSYGKADWMFSEWVAAHKSDNLQYRDTGASIDVGYVGWRESEFYCSAYTKRVMALLMARCGYTYTFKNYVNLDGVSGLIYNTAYVFSIPRKILTGMFTAEGAGEYLWNTTKMLIGGVFAVVGIPLSLVVNTICHPLETLANLTVGIAYFGDGWGTYVANTNLIASLWDLIWGAIIYPLVQAAVFFM